MEHAKLNGRPGIKFGLTHCREKIKWSKNN